MARQLWVEYQGAIHHVSVRSNAGAALFVRRLLQRVESKFVLSGLPIPHD